MYKKNTMGNVPGKGPYSFRVGGQICHNVSDFVN
jgi:hypothetical protein